MVKITSHNFMVQDLRQGLPRGFSVCLMVYSWKIWAGLESPSHLHSCVLSRDRWLEARTQLGPSTGVPPPGLPSMADSGQSDSSMVAQGSKKNVPANKSFLYDLL